MPPMNHTRMYRKVLWFFNIKRGNHIFRNTPVTKTLIAQILLIFFISVSLSVIFTENPPVVAFTNDYIALLCGTEKFGTASNETVIGIRPEQDTEADGVESQLLNVARKIHLNSRTVLFTVINEAYLPFAYSWLCNTKPMNIHKSVLIVTTDKQAKAKLNSDWPEINIISMDIDNLRGNQSYSQVGYIKITVKRTEMIQFLLMANIDVFVFEVDCLWLANPLPGISFNQQDDIIVNPVAGTNNEIFASGFIWLRSTCRAKIIWQKVTDLMVALGEKVKHLPETTVLETYEDENEQKYLAKLIREGYADVTLKILPLEMYADGQWYKFTEVERLKLHPIVINNNWIIGNDAKIERAKLWNHWFVRTDLTCDMDLVYKTLY
ncbi:uncharacterized protein LOC123539513 [Mercenaria mercenaria]|uniref:uncharacterized protein LOC123539513 n=1 Tax=Mercenaria mercenaria TaxID=6596 RepID=UPI00234ED878|nr:uncharacterized protein LOC123539513 [Mercenaria mercenaria]XP_045180104.2 uncharacterized protein LOC123539513 [Mercenaria mercenaria]XP_053385472.1 uncharacterized protein LOC123539513 [Mercenaria mercenaria]XP_053385473.1 uncharacterized protein LOC123539513 [Mercenaria mercenaria]